MKCVSCGISLESQKMSVRFPCPGCSTELGRCGSCRENSVRYKCKCGFEGP